MTALHARCFSRFPALLLYAAALPHAAAQTTYYVHTTLVSDTAPDAPIIDPNLKNPWGLAAAPNGPWWVSDEQDGLSSVYTDTGSIVPTLISVPSSQSDSTRNGTPTGVVYNSTPANFLGASFLYCTHDGTISAVLNNAPVASVQVDNGAVGSSYTGLAVLATATNALLYAANFASGKIEVYNAAFSPIALPAGAFTDPSLPARMHPFNVAVVNNLVFVAYAVYSAAGPVAGAGNGFIDAYSPGGVLQKQFAHGNFLNAPWGLVRSPASFGEFSNALLVGQQGSGTIVAFNLRTGAEAGTLDTAPGTPIVIPELWGLAFGTGGTAGPATALFFTSGLTNDKHGEFGTVTVNSN